VSRRAWIVAILVLALVGSIFALPGAQVVAPAKAQAGDFILNVGVQDEMKTRNMVRFMYFTGDVWTADALNPVSESTVQTHPETQDVIPYIMVGTDADGDLALDAAEIGRFAPEAADPNDWVAFFDVTGMRFHDGTQVQMEDLLFSYQLEGLSPAIGSARFVKDRAGGSGTNYTETRWLWVNPVPLASWLGSAPNTPGQFALRFKQTGPNAQFNRDTLQTGLIPAYFWQGTGVRKQNGVIVATNIHPDFGWALNPDPAAGVYLNAVPTAGLTTTQAVSFEGINIAAGTALKAFDINSASVGCPAGNPSCPNPWEAQDQDVIGAGPFRFVTWEAGSFVRLEVNPDYFIPDASVAQATLDVGLRVPAMDAIVYRLYRNVQASIFALQAGDIDFTDWNVPPEFVAPLLADPNVGLKTSADAGFFYMSYNFRKLPFGYADPSVGSNNPANDIGKPFRLAVAHASDKRTIVTSLLQNFGVPGHTVVSPTNTLYYNDSAPRYAFDMTRAAALLDAYGPDPAGACQVDGTGCRSLPGKGTSLIEILTPQADYDPIRAAAGTLIAQNLRQIGVNIVSKPTAFGQIVTRVFDLQDFDMWILGWSLTGFIVPSYMWDFFYSKNVDLSEDNAEGYVNETLDKVLDQAIAAAPGSPEAVRLWKWAQGIVAGDQAYNVLFYRTNIFAFRQDKVDSASWKVDIGGDVWFYWSWILLDPAPPGLITASASAPSAVSSGGTATITVTVRDPELNRLPGATVDFTVTTPQGGTVSPGTATTDSNGQATTTFTAPTLAAGQTPLSTFIQIRATSTQFGAAKDISVVITTFPPGQQFLNLFVDLPFGNVVNEGGTTVLEIDLTDETGLPAAGADVLLSLQPTGNNILSETQFTSTASTKSITFTAPLVTADETYTITVSAARVGVQGSTTVQITVLDVPPVVQAVAGGELLLIVGAVVGVGAAGGGYYLVRRRRMKK